MEIKKSEETLKAEIDYLSEENKKLEEENKKLLEEINILELRLQAKRWT